MRKLIAALILFCSLSSAGTITSFLPDFDGPSDQSGFPVDLGVIGSFNYLLPGGVTITGASIGGDFGTFSHPLSTAAFNISIAGTTLVACTQGDPGCYLAGAAQRPFALSLPASSFAHLLAGDAHLKIIQTSDVVVRYGTPTLTIHYRDGQVPEPATWLLTAAGAAATLVLRRRSTR